MRWTIEPITSPTGSKPATSSPAAAGADSSDVHAPPAAARRTRSAATGGRPRPSQSATSPTLVTFGDDPAEGAVEQVRAVGAAERRGGVGQRGGGALGTQVQSDVAQVACREHAAFERAPVRGRVRHGDVAG